MTDTRTYVGMHVPICMYSVGRYVNMHVDVGIVWRTRQTTPTGTMVFPDA